MNHLTIRSGPLHLLLPTTGILEVAEDAGGETARHALWRGQAVPTVSLRRLFGLDATEEEAVRIVHESGGAPVIYLADAVLGLRRLEEHDLLPLPPLAAPYSRWFDRASPAPDGGRLLLRCRLPLVESIDREVPVQDPHDQTAHR